MVRSALSKVAWVGRTASMVFGLALVMALVFGVASMAFGANGGNFILGNLKNSATALTRLTGNVNGAAMQVVNNNTGTDDTALALNVQSGEAPMRVNSATKVANLNADRIDDREASSFANAAHSHSGTDITSGTVAEGRIDATVTRDGEVMPTVKANDGSGSGVDADQLDGKTSADFASAYKRTVVVSPVGTDAQNGTALLSALSGITDASATKPYLLYIEAGTYDLGTNKLYMKQHVDIQGAEELKTLITSSVSSSTCAGTVYGANNAELRFLTARNTGTTDCSVGIYNYSASPRLTNVTAESTGAGGSSHYAVYNNASSPTITNVKATASGGSSYNLGVFITGGSSPTIKHSSLSGSTNSLYISHGSGAAASSTTKVALNQLSGPIKRVDGGLQCFNNYDENMGAVTCP